GLGIVMAGGSVIHFAVRWDAGLPTLRHEMQWAALFYALGYGALLLAAGVLRLAEGRQERPRPETPEKAPLLEEEGRFGMAARAYEREGQLDRGAEAAERAGE